MPQSGAGLYEVVLVQDYISQRCLNVFHYKSNTSEDDIQFQCGTAFNVDNLPDIALIQSEDLTYQDILVRNITGTLADAAVTPTTAAGNVVGLELATFYAASFRYNRVSKDTRNGAKRFTGMVEENVQNNSFTGAFQTLMDALAIVLDNDISSAGKTFQPIILRKPSLGAGVWQYSDVQTVTALDRATTQNSRKSF